MRIERDPSKERVNIQKHGFDFSLAERIISDPLAVTYYDRFEGGEDRRHTVATVGSKTLLVVHTSPDGDEADWLRVISLRVATAHERRWYERRKG